MGFTMVPVPDEHVLEIMEIVLRVSSGDTEEEPEEFANWDFDAMKSFYLRSEPETRKLLLYLAQNHAGEKALTADIASGIGRDRSELAGIVGPLKRRAKSLGRVSPVRSMATTNKSPDGRRVFNRSLLMPQDVAEMVIRASALKLVPKKPPRQLRRD